MSKKIINPKIPTIAKIMIVNRPYKPMEAERYVNQISDVLIKPLNDLEKETFNELKYSF